MPLLKKVDKRFILNLNKKLYKEDFVNKLLAGDKDWVKKISSKGKYLCLEFKTKKIEQVLDWANYLLYTARAA